MEDKVKALIWAGSAVAVTLGMGAIKLVSVALDTVVVFLEGGM